MSRGTNKNRDVKRTMGGVIINRNGNPIMGVMKSNVTAGDLVIQIAKRHNLKRLPKY